MAVLDGGRLKPVSTYAGFHLLRTLGKRSFVVDTPEGKRKLSPVEWMLDCMFRPELAEQYPVFLVNREEVVRRLHLPDQKDKRKKYSYAQLAERWEEMTRAVREIRLLGETNLTEAQKEILSLARNFDVMRGWMLVSRIMLENPAAMERMEFPRWFPSAGRDGERLWTAAPDKAAGAFLAMASLLERKAIGMEGAEASALRMKAEGLLLESWRNPMKPPPPESGTAWKEKFSTTVWIRFIFPWPFLWRRSCACCSVRFSALPPTLPSGGVFFGPEVSAWRG